jgi:hypothetical protein
VAPGAEAAAAEAERVVGAEVGRVAAEREAVEVVRATEAAEQVAAGTAVAGSAESSRAAVPASA